LLEIPTKPEQKISTENMKTLVSRIDFGGCIIATVGIIGLLLSMNFGSGALGYDWSSPVVIGILVGSFVVGLVFILYEKFVASSPLFPSKIIMHKDMALVYLLQIIDGFYYIILTLTPVITFQSVFNNTSLVASLKLLPGVFTFIICNYIQPRIAKKLKTPKVTHILLM
jgi:hypothetical protein